MSSSAAKPEALNLACAPESQYGVTVAPELLYFSSPD